MFWRYNGTCAANNQRNRTQSNRHSHGASGDRGCTTRPIYAVDKAMEWATQDTRNFVDDLVKRGLIHWVPIVANGPMYNPKSYWKEGPLNAR
jgi:hypothetical protein